MPTYQYTCIECDNSVDLQKAVDDRDEPVICDGCGNLRKRSWNAPSITFNGPGFYSTGG